MKALIITVISILLGLGASLANVVWIAVLATVVALAGAYAQYRDSIPFVFIFSSANWQQIDDEYRLVISRKKHNKDSPIATVLEGTGSNYEEVSVDVRTDAEGAVVVAATITFDGKIIIR